MLVYTSTGRMHEVGGYVYFAKENKRHRWIFHVLFAPYHRHGGSKITIEILSSQFQNSVPHHDGNLFYIAAHDTQRWMMEHFLTWHFTLTRDKFPTSNQVCKLLKYNSEAYRWVGFYRPVGENKARPKQNGQVNMVSYVLRFKCCQDLLYNRASHICVCVFSLSFNSFLWCPWR